MEKARETLSKVGFRYCIFFVAVVIVQMGGILLLKKCFPELVVAHASECSFVLIMLSVDVIGFPTIWALLKGFEKADMPDKPFGILNLLQSIFVCYTILYIGSVIGTILSRLIFHSSGNVVGSLMSGSGGSVLLILCIGIGAPVFEELIFRKLLIDRIAYRGKLLAIITSGLIFGLYHGNLSQFFYATGLGVFFAYIYVKTGRIRYTIALHMVINMYSSVVGVAVMKYAAKYGVDVNNPMASLSSGMNPGLIALSLYGLMMMGLAGVGFIIIVLNICLNRKNLAIEEISDENEGVRGGKVFKAFFTSYGMIGFVILCILLFIYQGMLIVKM